MFRRKKRIRRNTYKGRHKTRMAAFLFQTRRIARVGMAAGFFVLFNLMLIFGYDWITQTEHLQIQSITVTGCERLTPEAVKQQAGLQSARNILAVNLTTTRKRLLAHPWIAEAQVSRDIPDRLRIQIREHTCLAVLDLGRRFLLSDEGRVFKELAPGETLNVPVVSGLTYTDLEHHAEGPSPVLRSVMEILKPRQRSNRQGLVPQIREIHADPALGLTLFMADERHPGDYRTVVLGFEDFDEKYATLERIDAYLRRKGHYAGFKSIDLNNLNRIIVHPMAAGASEEARKEV
jgi:cell division protein FtsQ